MECHIFLSWISLLVFIFFRLLNDKENFVMIISIFVQYAADSLFTTTTTGNEAARAQYLPLLWPVRQSGAAIKPNDVILTNLKTSHCFNPIPQPISSLSFQERDKFWFNCESSKFPIEQEFLFQSSLFSQRNGMHLMPNIQEFCTGLKFQKCEITSFTIRASWQVKAVVRWSTFFTLISLEAR